MIEAAAALAGFAGIVATLKREGLTRLDRLQMENLLSCAFSALFLSIFALVLIHATVEIAATWRILSATWFVVGVAATARNAVNYRRLFREEEDQSLRPMNLFWFGSAFAVLLLQVYNSALAGQFWPVLVGISWLFGLSCYSFWQLLVRNN